MSAVAFLSRGVDTERSMCCDGKWRDKVFPLSKTSSGAFDGPHRCRCTASVVKMTSFVSSDSGTKLVPETSVDQGYALMVHWRGEAMEDYTLPFRHLEFLNSIKAVLNEERYNNNNYHDASDSIPIQFVNAFSSPSSSLTINHQNKIEGIENNRQQNLFDQSLQYIKYQQNDSNNNNNNNKNNFPTMDIFVKAAKRCALVNGLYQIISSGASYENLIEMAQTTDAFHEMADKDGIYNNSTWSFRLKYFGSSSSDGLLSTANNGEKRFGDRTTRSIKKEKQALEELKDLFAAFGGNVNLTNPDIRIVLFEGLGVNGSEKVLTKRIAAGPKVSILNPNTRYCVTNTPLCPITSIIMSNIGQITCSKNKILDPYAGSCSTLLSSTLIEPSCQTVGIDIADDTSVNRTDIITDFTSRKLKPPNALLTGDIRNETIRDEARCAIGDEPFDVILTDPPYGIREKQDWTLSSQHYPWSSSSSSSSDNNPLLDIFTIIAMDIKRGKPLLDTTHGRLVVFVPCTAQQDIKDMLPNETLMEEARLVLESRVEQRLNDALSRWLLVYKSADI